MVLESTILATYKTLPTLIDGKVCIIAKDNSYKLVKPASFVNINDGFDPLCYCYAKFKHDASGDIFYRIIYSKPEDRERYAVASEIRRINAIVESMRKQIFVGCIVHLHGRLGIYTVKSIKGDAIELTCKSWANNDDEHKTIIIDINRLSCLAGGIYNNPHSK